MQGSIFDAHFFDHFLNNKQQDVETLAQMRCSVKNYVKRKNSMKYCSHNEDKEAAVLMEYDSMTEKPSEDLLRCSQAFGLDWSVRAYVADVFKPFLRGTLYPLVLTAY